MLFHVYFSHRGVRPRAALVLSGYCFLLAQGGAPIAGSNRHGLYPITFDLQGSYYVIMTMECCPLLFQKKITARNSICGKVMFSQMSVILSTGRRWVCLKGLFQREGVSIVGVSMSRGGLGIPVGGEYVQG